MKTKFKTPHSKSKAKLRIQVSLSGHAVACAERLIKLDCRTGLSNLLEALTGQEYQRRFPGEPSPLILKKGVQ